MDRLAILDRLFAADDNASTWGARVGAFLRSMPSADLGAGAVTISAGLELLNQESPGAGDLP